MATFEVQVEGNTGLDIGASGSPTQAELTQYLLDGIREVVNRIITINPIEMTKFCTTTNSTTKVMKTGTILSVMREHDSTSILRSCAMISPENRYDATDANSLNYRTKYNPGFYELDGYIHCVPEAGSGNNDIVVTQVKFTTSTAYSSSDIDDFPYEYEYLVVLYASIKSLQNVLSTKDDDLPSDLNAPVLHTTSTSLPSYTGPTSFVMPVAPSGVDVDFSGIGSIETFVAPTFSAPSLGSISSMSLPSVPVAPSLSAASVSITGTAPTYTAPILSLSSAPTISNLSISASEPVVPVLSDTTISESSITAPTFVVPVMGDLDFSDTNNWISTEEDSEMLQARVMEIQAKIEEHQANLQAAATEYGKNSEIFQKDIQIAISNAQLNSEDDAQKIQKYGQEVQIYRETVMKELQEYQANLEGDLRVWESERSHQLQQYQLDIGNNLNTFEKENVEYQAKLQKDITDAQFSDSLDSKELETYSINVQKYAQEVNTEVQRWTGEVFNKEFNEWTQKYQGQLETYGADIQKESARVAASLQDYQVEVDKALSQYQSETGYDITKYQSEIQAHMNKFESDLTEKSTEFQNNLAKYSSEYEKVVSDNQTEVMKFQHQTQDYINKVQKVMASYEWMVGRLTMLQGQYDTAFSVMAPQQQQQQGEQ
jgi:hypothetical protein